MSTTIIYGSLWPDGHFGREVATNFGDRVTQNTDGEYVVEVTPASADADLTKQVIKGEIQMTSGHAIQDYVPELGISYLPYIYRSFDQFRAIWTLGQSPVSDRIVQATQQRGIPVTILGYSIIGFRDTILREKQIVSAPDFNGLKIRVDGSAGSVGTFKAFGSDPITVEYHKVKQALANGDIDAAENTSYNLIYMGWYEECKYISLTQHLMLNNVELVNNDFWTSLSAQVREVIQSSMNSAVAEFANKSQVHRAEAIQQLQDLGLTVNMISNEAHDELAAEVADFNARYITQYSLESEFNYIQAH